MIFILLNEERELHEAMKTIICFLLQGIVEVTPEQIQVQNDRQFVGPTILIEGNITDDDFDKITTALRERLSLEVHHVGL